MINEPLPIPHDDKAERVVIGAMLSGKRQLNEMLQLVTSAEMFREAHAQIVASIETLAERNDDANPLTVLALQKARGQEEANGGAAYLRACQGAYADLDGVARRAARTVRELAQRRNLVAFAATADKTARDLEQPFDRVLNATVGAAHNILRQSQTGQQGLIPMATKDPQTWDMLERAAHGYLGVSTVRFGIPGVDKALAPLDRQRVMVGKGGTGVGKTHLAVQMAGATALALREAGEIGNVLLWSFEGRGLYQQRLLAWLSGVNSNLLHHGFNGADGAGGTANYQALREARDTLKTLPISICEDTTNQAGVEAQLRVHAEKHPVKLAIVDYWQTMRRRSGRNDLEEYEAAAYAFRDLADELGFPIMVLSQETYNPQTGVSIAKNSRAVEEVATLIVRLSVDKKKSPPVYSIAVEKTRLTPYVAPQELVVDLGCSRIWDKASVDATNALAEAHDTERSWPNNE